VTFREAADLGIDSLEHGWSASTDFVKGKEADLCPARGPNDVDPEITSAPVQDLIRYLVGKRWRSCLPVAEAGESAAAAAAVSRRALTGFEGGLSDGASQTDEGRARA
jgi:hypothetical protein